jgi:ribonuclease HII
VGIDENGMGPRLGPLVVTSVLAQSDPELAGARLATSRPRGALAKRIGDSKKLVAFDDSTLGEAWARAIVGCNAGRPPQTPGELLTRVALDSDDALRSPCPAHHSDLCWGDAGEAFASSDDEVARCRKDIERLAARGLTVREVRVAIVCVRKLNEAVDAGLSRFDVDLHTMERLALAARARAEADIYALCGKVGGFDFYGERFGPLAGRLHTVLIEGRARSEYQLPGIGRLSFLRDADESHLLVGLASLVGKWVRDHLMRRVVRWHRSHLPGRDDIPEASGYHDPVTSRFVAATALVRKKLRVEGMCFERTSLTKKENELAALDPTSLGSAPTPPKGAPSARNPTSSPAQRTKRSAPRGSSSRSSRREEATPRAAASSSRSLPPS